MTKKNKISFVAYASFFLLVTVLFFWGVLGYVIGEEDTEQPPKIRLELTTDSLKKEYDGLPAFAPTYKITGGELMPEHSLEVVILNELTSVGEIYNYIETANIFDAEGNDVTQGYDITIVLGRLVILPRKLTVLQIGAPSKPEYIISDGTVPNNETVKFNTSSGSSGGFMNIVNQHGQSTLLNYEISYIDASNEFSPVELTIKSANSGKKYDGTPLSAGKFEILEGALIEGDVITVYDYSKYTDVGEYDNFITVKVTRSMNGAMLDVSHFYKITYIYGKLIINP